MAITNVIDGVTAVVAVAAATSFTIAGAATITADNFLVGEYAFVYRLGPSGAYVVATNERGAIVLSAIPNTAVIDGPGTYKIGKTLTTSAAYVGYEE